MSAPVNKLHANKYEELVRRRGRIVRWQEAIMCSCWTDLQHPLYDCNACNGYGYTYADPIDDLAIVQSVAHNKEFEEMAGVFEIGDAIMSVGRFVAEVNPVTGHPNMRVPGRENPIFHVGMFDLITLLDDDYKTSELLVKGRDIYGRPPDTLLNEDVVEVRAVRKSDIITGDITHYEAGTDYEVVGNRIEWLSDGPGDGEQYSVQYTHRPVFTVLTQLPSPRYQDGQDLPKKVALRYRAGGYDRK